MTLRGRSFNVTDGIVRLKLEDFALDASGTVGVRVSLWPTAYTFQAGHRLRFQVSSADIQIEEFVWGQSSVFWLLQCFCLYQRGNINQLKSNLAILTEKEQPFTR
jgi:predicted acyl esterase